MKTPKRIEPLVQDGLVDEVIRQLMSGKEATVYVVRCGEEIRCAKVYKEPDDVFRSFRPGTSNHRIRKRDLVALRTRRPGAGRQAYRAFRADPETR